jgi:hypothetical protein
MSVTLSSPIFSVVESVKEVEKINIQSATENHRNDRTQLKNQSVL